MVDEEAGTAGAGTQEAGTAGCGEKSGPEPVVDPGSDEHGGGGP